MFISRDFSPLRRFVGGIPVARETTLAMSLEVTASCKSVVVALASSASSGGMAFSRAGMVE